VEINTAIKALQLRAGLWRNGFRPIPVYSSPAEDRKKPFGKEWQLTARVNPPACSQQFSPEHALNTGILCDGLRAIDIDIDIPELANQVQALALEMLGPAPIRTRFGSSRVLLLYRAAEGEPNKKTEKGDLGSVEILGHGNQFVAFGLHLDGSQYEWLNGSPLDADVSKLTPVTAEAELAFRRAVKPLIGSQVKSDTEDAPLAPHVVQVAETIIIGERELTYGAAVLKNECFNVASLKAGDGRNPRLNEAAFRIGRRVGAGFVTRADAEQALLEAADACGTVADKGRKQTLATIASGLDSGIAKPDSSIAEVPVIEGLKAVVASLDPGKKKQMKSAASLELIGMDSIQEEKVDWLWKGYLPKGKLTLLSGDGGEGKSTITCSLAATITTAGEWPDHSRCEHAGFVLFWSSEDDPGDTIKPRLMAAGADVTRVGMIGNALDENGEPMPFDPAIHFGKLAEKLRASHGGISLLVIDPIVTAITGDMNKANDVRRSLQAIVDFAKEFDCAVIGITHSPKNARGAKLVHRVIGSQAFTAYARNNLFVHHDSASGQRLFGRSKANNAGKDGGFMYDITPVNVLSEKAGAIETTKIEWVGMFQGDPDERIAASEGRTTDEPQNKKQSAQQFLEEMMKDGPKPSTEVIEHGIEQGFTKDTLHRARKALGIQAVKQGMEGGWVWQYPMNFSRLSPFPLSSGEQVQ
jgi:hypothetical protein